ncbi:MAG: DUF3293 domain-containing protein [Gemmatimonadota bacterium]
MPSDPRLDPARAWYYDVRFRTVDLVDTWPAEFVIITGYATTGETWTPEENEAANAQLESELQTLRRWYAPITGYSSETQHAEPGFAVAMSAAEGTALGRRYRQDAIFVVRLGQLSVRYCADEREDLVTEDWSGLID